MIASPRAESWAAYVCAGGTASWQKWDESAQHSAPPLPDGRVPGAQYVELIRRINERSPLPASVVAEIVSTPAPGRGRPELGIADTTQPEPGWGPPRVIPEQLPAEEFLRVATGVIAERLAAQHPDLPVKVRRRSRLRGARHRGGVCIVGGATQLQWARTLAVNHGVTLNRTSPDEVWILGAPVDRLFSDRWQQAVVAGAAMNFRDYLASWLKAGSLPDGVRLVQQARRLGAEFPDARVRVVTGPEQLRTHLGASSAGSPPVLGTAAVLLLRQVRKVLPLLVAEDLHGALLQNRLAPQLSGLGPPVRVAATTNRRLQSLATNVAASLNDDGVELIGSSDDLQPIAPLGRAAVAQRAVLGVALDHLAGHHG